MVQEEEEELIVGEGDVEKQKKKAREGNENNKS